MNSLLVVLLVGVSASMAAPSGLLGLGYGGYGLGTTYLGAPYGAPTLLAAAPGGVTISKTIPGYIATSKVYAAPVIAAPAVVAAAPAVVAASPAVAASAVVAGPSGLIKSTQVNPGGVATIAAAPYSVASYGGYGYGSWEH